MRRGRVNTYIELSKYIVIKSYLSLIVCYVTVVFCPEDVLRKKEENEVIT